MKKALKILGIAIVAAAVFAGCEQGPQEVDAKVSYKQGTLNYDLEGKKLTHVETSYFTKSTTVQDTTKAGSAVTTTEKTAYKTVTTEYAFNDDDDNTYTETVTTVFLPGADGNFRTYSNTPAGTTINTYINYYGDDEFNANYDGYVIAGLAGLTESVRVTNGTWSSYKRVDSPSDPLTLEYAINTTSSVNTYTAYGSTPSSVPVDPNYSTTAKKIYAVTGGSETYNSTFDNYWTMTPQSTGTKVVGDEEYDVIQFQNSYYDEDAEETYYYTTAFTVSDIED